MGEEEEEAQGEAARKDVVTVQYIKKKELKNKQKIFLDLMHASSIKVHP